VLDLFIAESSVVNCRFIVYSLARGSPKQRGRFFGSALLTKRHRNILELQPTPRDASRIPGLSRLPAVFTSGLEFRLRISVLSEFEFSVVLPLDLR
jgi:hypothetical protein